MHLDVAEARRLAARLLVDDIDHWLHTQAAARRAEEVAGVVGPLDRNLLMCATWLHDIGFCADLAITGFHPLDGATYLAAAGWPERLVGLVAHHSHARDIAAARGLTAELARFPREEGAVADALVYADMSTGPRGERMSLQQRLDDIESRHGDESPALRLARSARRRPLTQAVERTEHRLCGMRKATRPASRA